MLADFTTTLLIDANNLVNREFHGLGKIQDPEWVGPATAFGFLRALSKIINIWEPTHVALCWDSINSKRAGIYPQYKANRREAREKNTEEEKELRRVFYQWSDKLRDKILPYCGFQNNYLVDGLEADDLIAQLAKQQDGNTVIITSDKDMLQCVKSNVRWWCPAIGQRNARVYTENDVIEEFRLKPPRLAHLKALIGCSTDNVPGAVQIGEARGIAFFKGELPQTNRFWQNATDFIRSPEYVRNLTLVELPFQDTEELPLPKKDAPYKWEETIQKLGFSMKDFEL